MAAIAQQRTMTRLLLAVASEERSMSTAGGCPTSIATQLQAAI